jgi:hypothetical protein
MASTVREALPEGEGRGAHELSVAGQVDDLSLRKSGHVDERRRLPLHTPSRRLVFAAVVVDVVDIVVVAKQAQLILK